MSTPPPPPPGSPRPPAPPRPPAIPSNLVARAEAIFGTVLDLPEAQRERFLVAECGDDEGLLQRVRALLAARSAAPDFLEVPPLSPEVEEQLARLKPEEGGEMIGPYKLREQIGEGGFGAVWVADQERPVRRRVALKIIKMGMDTKEVIARFEQERQALAMMDHPNIARVFDAGATQYGRPFFVMELVRGVKITDYCDDQQLPTDERIELFITVCQAVQHAHQKGIIHRDLKPSNILVTINDGKAVVKVIDFGVAKATQGRLVEQTVYTQFQQMMGTPLYMSPEQAELTSLDIDTRSDIYALGVLLYELLTSRTPIDTATMAQAGMDEVRRLIREIDPPRPSIRVKTLEAAELTTAAKRRHTEAAKLPGALRGDLDWIVMKCIEKDRSRRYDTANGLALDLQRYLKNGVVSARPPTATYLLSRIIRRNKLAFAAGAAIAVSLVAGIAATTRQLAHTKKAEQRAVAAFDELRASAPAFAEQARALAARGYFDEAIEKLDYALKLRPDVAEYLVAKGDLLQGQLKLAEAAAIYRDALRVKPGIARAEASAKLCDELLAAPLSDQGKFTLESLAKLHRAMQQQQRPAAELTLVVRLLGEEKRLLLEYWLARLKGLPVSAEKPLARRLTVRDDGRLVLDLSATKVIDLSPLFGVPLAVLDVSRSNELTDLSPLHGIDLIELNISGTSVADLTPLREMHTLEKLNVSNSKVTDLTALRALRLDDLDLTHTRIFDISTLRGMKLKKLSLSYTGVTDLSPLEEIALTVLDLRGAPVADITPLRVPTLSDSLRAVRLSETKVTDFSPVAALTHLEIFDAASTPLADLSIVRDRKLHTIRVGNTKVTDISELAGMPLTTVWIDATAITDISPLLKCPTLEELLLPARARDVGALRALPKLTALSYAYKGLAGTQKAAEFWKEYDQGWLRALQELGIKPKTLKRLPNSTWEMDLDSSAIRNLGILSAAPISKLNLGHTAVSDLAPLSGMALKELTLVNTKVTDLSWLKGMQLEYLHVGGTEVTDLSALREMALKTLHLNNTKVTDLTALRSPTLSSSLREVVLSGTRVTDFSPLAACTKLETLDATGSVLADLAIVRGRKLRIISLVDTKVTDISELAGMPLTRVLLRGTGVTDLSPLLHCPTLQELVLPAGARNVDSLRALPALKALSYDNKPGGLPAQTTEEFWKEFDAKK